MRSMQKYIHQNIYQNIYRIIYQNIHQIVEKGWVEICGESLFFRNSGRTRSI